MRWRAMPGPWHPRQGGCTTVPQPRVALRSGAGQVRDAPARCCLAHWCSQTRSHRHAYARHPRPFGVPFVPLFAYPFCSGWSGQEPLTHKTDRKLWLVLPATELGPNLAPAEAASRQPLIVFSRNGNRSLHCILKRDWLKEV